MAKARPKRDEERENRITMEIVGDAYDEIERAMGWYYHLDNNLRFPFKATCIARRATSPLRLKDEVEVIGMPDEEECEREMFITIRRGKDELAVPLSQLQPVASTDDQRKQAVEDWHYWVAMGYEF